MRGDTDYLKDIEDEDNDSVEAEIVTEEDEEVETDNTDDEVELFLLTQGAASTRRSCAVQRSVVLVVTSPSSLLLSVSGQPGPDGGVSSSLS